MGRLVQAIPTSLRPNVYGVIFRDRNEHHNRSHTQQCDTRTGLPQIDSLLFDVDEKTIMRRDVAILYNNAYHLLIAGTYFAISLLLEPIFDTIAKQ